MKKRVCIVDDNSDLKELYEIAFRDSEFDLTFITSSLEALSYLDRNEADIVLIDLAMREMDGLALAREIRVNEDKNGTRSARLAWFTALPITDATRRFAKRYEVEKTFTKPTDPLSLIHEIRAWLSEPAPQPATTQQSVERQRGVTNTVFAVWTVGIILIGLLIGAYVVIKDKLDTYEAYKYTEMRKNRDMLFDACNDMSKRYSTLIEWNRQQAQKPPPELLVKSECVQLNKEQNHEP